MKSSKDGLTADGVPFYVCVNKTGNSLSLITASSRTVQGSLTVDKTKTFLTDSPYRAWPGYYRGVLAYLREKYKFANTGRNRDLKYVFVIDEINRGDISKIFGELFFAIDPGYRGKAGMVQTQYQTMVKDGAFCEGFYVPDNVYIIATMNDIDRSVESMDFAIRRRFRWHEIKPSDNAEMLNQLPHEFAEKARSTMDSINRWIDNEAGLGSAFEIGPAYFLKLNKELSLNDAFEDLLCFHIEPLLREYLRGQGDLETKLESAREAFRKPDGAN